MKHSGVFWVMCLTVPFLRASQAMPAVTSAPHGPFHVEERAIIDRTGKPFLVRGTQLPGFGLSVNGYAPDSATALITIRQRWNMNAVRIPLSLAEFDRDPAYLARVGEVVRRANSLELLVILSASSDEADAARFWRTAAGFFEDYPNLMFAASAAEIPAIRAAGARQIVIIPAVAANLSSDANIVLEISPRWNELREPLLLPAPDVPVIVNDLDLHLESPQQCAALPKDPSAVEELVELTLTDFDERGISWTISSFQPGKLINDYRYLGVSRVDNGWKCGGPSTDDHTGMGMVVQFHLWKAELRGLMVVDAASGGFVLARGGMAIGYGPIFAARDTLVPQRKFRAALAGISVRLTDSQGVSRPALMSYVSEGWGQINILIPADCATGVAQIAVLRADGTQSTANVIIDDVAPGIWTGGGNGRGPAMGFIEPRGTPIFKCPNDDPWQCQALPIPLPATVRFRASGLRYAGAQDLRVTIGGMVVHGAMVRRGSDPGEDELRLDLPQSLYGLGETDMVFRLRGRLSNVVRVNLGLRARKREPARSESSAAELGRFLFYDKRLSVNGSTSCATCHRQELAFTDGKAKSEGATGEFHPRSAMSLVNVAAESPPLTWSNPNLRSLEVQALTPMFANSPIELGSDERALPAMLRSDSMYRTTFAAAFPAEADPFSVSNVAKAIAAFERTIHSRRSPYDRYHFDDERDAISESAKRGEVLFFSPAVGCGHCHSGRDFSDGQFHNTGLYDPYPEPNVGIARFTHRPEDNGKFRTPTLRNIALTAPYMHDGSIPTLDAVLDHYAAGGRTRNRNKDRRLTGFYLSPQNRTDLLAFLQALTDEEVIHDPRLSDPWLKRGFTKENSARTSPASGRSVRPRSPTRPRFGCACSRTCPSDLSG